MMTFFIVYENNPKTLTHEDVNCTFDNESCFVNSGWHNVKSYVVD